MGNGARLGTKRNVLWRPVKIHRQMVRGRASSARGERRNWLVGYCVQVRYKLVKRSIGAQQWQPKSKS